MPYEFQFRPYGRSFKPPLQTSHGSWDVREGIILRLKGESRSGWGEIAPLSWFGSETLKQALDFCQQLPDKITAETIFSIPDDLPACQFGFESAWKELQGSEWQLPSSLTYSALLPAGKAALQTWQTLWDQGYRTFKWKIGVYSIPDELQIFDLLTQTLPAAAKLRLDANGGLTYDDANLWLWTCDNVRVADKRLLEIEFIEQPLPVEQFEEMQKLSMCYSTPIALDESVAMLKQLKACYQQGWRGIFVIKPGIAGSPKRLRQFCHNHKIDAVFSSVFETVVGRRSALSLAAELSRPNRAVGFGVNHWLNKDDEIWLRHLWQC